MKKSYTILSLMLCLSFSPWNMSLAQLEEDEWEEEYPLEDERPVPYTIKDPRHKGAKHPSRDKSKLRSNVKSQHRVQAKIVNGKLMLRKSAGGYQPAPDGVYAVGKGKKLVVKNGRLVGASRMNLPKSGFNVKAVK